MTNKLKKKLSNSSLKNAIKSLDLDMTMEEFGAKLNYSKAAVSKYLGDFPPSKSFLSKFEEVFQVSLKDFEEDFVDNLSDLKSTQEDLGEIEALKELVKELKERVSDLKESLNEERESKKYFKDEYDLLKKYSPEIKKDIN